MNDDSDNQKESLDEKDHRNRKDDKLRKNKDNDASMIQDLSSLDISKEA